jgi:hypothetical protein
VPAFADRVCHVVSVNRYNMGLNNNYLHVGFEVFTAVTMKNAVFWEVAPCGFCKNQCFGGTCLHLQGRKNPRAKKNVGSWLTV